MPGGALSSSSQRHLRRAPSRSADQVFTVEFKLTGYGSSFGRTAIVPVEALDSAQMLDLPIAFGPKTTWNPGPGDSISNGWSMPGSRSILSRLNFMTDRRFILGQHCVQGRHPGSNQKSHAQPRQTADRSRSDAR